MIVLLVWRHLVAEAVVLMGFLLWMCWTLEAERWLEVLEWRCLRVALALSCLEVLGC